MSKQITVMIKNLCGLAILLFLFIACDKEDAKPTTRTYRMGFQNSAPHLTFEEAILSLNIWTQRADAAIITADVPWDSLFDGKTSEDVVLENYKGLVDFYRSKNLKLWVYIEPANGLDRAAEAPSLVKKDRSMTEIEIQEMYKRFAFVMDSMLMPEHMGLALETNLIRALAPEPIYLAIKNAANDAATEIRAYDSDVKLSVSVQVDWAWGRLTDPALPYQGITQDFTDFPFIEELGLSSYPYFGFDDPHDIPVDYYSKLVEGKGMPVFVSEGGWSSETVTSFTGTLQKQRDYFARQRDLLDHAKAIGLFQLTFTDADVSSFPPGTPENLGLFSHIGLVDINLEAKPALEEWDEIFKLRLVE
jgi:hypothetical protein